MVLGLGLVLDWLWRMLSQAAHRVQSVIEESREAGARVKSPGKRDPVLVVRL